MHLLTKRIYEGYSPDDGFRVLVDRLWPRGVRKEDAYIDLWAKDLAPSNSLRSWFHDNPDDRYDEFTTRYHQELSLNKTLAENLIHDHNNLTLITAVKDVEHSHVPVLTSFLESL